VVPITIFDDKMRY